MTPARALALTGAVAFVVALAPACGDTTEPGPAASACPVGLAECDGRCVDSSRDEEHCGACGVACEAGFSCDAGACSLSCQAGLTACDGTCTDVSRDNAHCGSCENPCEPGMVCDGGGQCAVSCQPGLTECGGLCTDTDHHSQHCGECGNACPPGTVCDGIGSCSVECAQGFVSCADVCVDPLTDSVHCGALGDCIGANAGETCGAGEKCDGAGSCALSCQESLIDCGGACVDPLTSNAHCGATGDCQGADAGIVCGAGEKCDGTGVCALSCQIALVDCGGTCVDPQTSEAHCGASGDCQGANAGVACSPGYLCNNGSCELSCQQGLVACNGVCTDPLTSPTNCGATGDCQGPNAGVSCSAGHVCDAGACVPSCTSGTTECSGGCFDLSSSPSHCGACGNACSAGEACFSGSCVFVGCDWTPSSFPQGTGAYDNSGWATMDGDCNLYWGTWSSNMLKRLPFGSSAQETVWWMGTQRPYGLAYHPSLDRVIVLVSGAQLYALEPTSTPTPTPIPMTGLPNQLNGLTYIPLGWGSHGGDLLVYMWTGEIWIADLDSGLASLLATLPGAVTGAAFDGTTLYALDHHGNRIVTITPTGTVSTFTMLSGCQPSGLSVDPAKRLFYACTASEEIHSYTLPAGPDTMIGQDFLENVSVPAVVLYDGVDSVIYSRLPGMWLDILEL